MNAASKPFPIDPRKSVRRRITPALVRLPQAAAICGLGKSTFDRHDAGGLIPRALHIGGCKVWSVAELKAWADHGCPVRTEWTPIWQMLLTARRTRPAK